MTKGDSIFRYTTENLVNSGIYTYKCKPNVENWNDSFNAEGTEGNSKVIVPGIVKHNLTVESGKTTNLLGGRIRKSIDKKVQEVL
ncbi:hypothetical protein [Cellulosilyticum ruminicola]|uniref:hypothetical protein n=1 Tax=Cellulosilyticum ruminicola TaxID=425254 RepID=UPI0006D07839|nr:hypothetical protein [Cellulosilyticum ruminicola]